MPYPVHIACIPNKQHHHSSKNPQQVSAQKSGEILKVVIAVHEVSGHRKAQANGQQDFPGVERTKYVFGLLIHLL
jgi:hypothetical protein